MEIKIKEHDSESPSEICLIFETKWLAEDEFSRMTANKYIAKFNINTDLLELILIDTKTKDELTFNKAKFNKNDFDVFIAKQINKTVFLLGFGIINNANYFRVNKPKEIYGF